MREKLKKLLSIVFIFIGLVLFVLPIVNPQKPIIIPKEDLQKTIGWKVYDNPEYHFLFKYPDGLLSNFHVQTTDKSQQTLKSLEQIKKSITASDPNSYNVIFEADGWKHKGNLLEFIDKNLPETRNINKQALLLNSSGGFRITNFDTKSDAYFYYNIFQHGDYIYNFAIFSDTPDLIRGNTQLLEDIISTVKFY